jgi:hypothetical protein
MGSTAGHVHGGCHAGVGDVERVELDVEGGRRDDDRYQSEQLRLD